ncbi:MAG: M48 family metallopeptidase [Bacteroidota bacterium]
MSRYIHLLFLCLFSLSLFAQDQQPMQLLEAEGRIPKEYITPSSKKYEKKSQSINRKGSANHRHKDQKEFALQSSFLLDDMLQSGLVLFNDPVSIYLNEVLLRIIRSNPSLNKWKDARIYTLRSPVVNAFATDQSIIFVSLGLLANLENEAQLAYVLSHELVHVRERHTLDLYLEGKEIGRNTKQKRILRESSFDPAVLAKNMHSRKLEFEADEGGWELFRNTGYSCRSLPNVFKMLFYAYLPYDERTFPIDYFNDEHYQLPDKYWKEKVQDITAFSDVEDETSTHPSAYKRLEKLQARIDQYKDEDKPDYIVSQEQFDRIVRQARYELPLLYLESELLAEAAYNSFLVQQDVVKDAHTQKVMAKALYMYAKYLYANEVPPGSAEDIEGASQQLYYLLEELPEREIIILALRYSWPLHKSYPEDEELKRINKDLFRMLAEYKSMEDFKKAPPVASSEKENSPVDSTKTLSKYDKIERQTEDKTYYWQFAFLPYWSDTTFVQAFERGIEEKEEDKERDEYFESYKGRKYVMKYRKDRAKGLRLGIDRITIVNPYYLKIDPRDKTNPTQFLKTEDRQVNFQNIIKEVSKQTKLKTKLLDVNSLSSKDIQEFNDIRHLSSWFDQQTQHFDMNLAPGYNQNVVDEIADRYGSDYFLWTGVISIKNAKRGYGHLFLSLLSPFYLPFSIHRKDIAGHDTLFYAMLFDVKTGRREVIKFEFFKYKDSNAIIKAHLYDALNQIVSKSKEK